MPRRCPPGVLCIENITITLFCIIGVVIGLWVYILRSRTAAASSASSASASSIYMLPPANNNNTNQGGGDVFLDPYQAPLRDDRCFTGGGGDIRGTVPINISTQGCDNAKYRQVGILTRLNGKEETILPLMGRPLFTRRDKWNFYTMNDKNNMIKLPITFKGRSCTDEYGCDNLYNGDTVFVEGYNDAFKVTAYDNQMLRYLPNSI